jgi:hypothetical protein
MSAVTIPENRRLPIRKAARLMGWGVSRVRRLVDTGKLIAYKVGGNDEAPRLQVDVDELERVIRRESVYVPPGLPERRRRRRIDVSELDPVVFRWKKRPSIPQ